MPVTKVIAAIKSNSLITSVSGTHNFLRASGAGHNEHIIVILSIPDHINLSRNLYFTFYMKGGRELYIWEIREMSLVMQENNYYAQSLNSQKLFKVYETGIPRVKQYLDAEISFVRDNLTGSERVLELGAGYGRIVKELAGHCKSIVGIDISAENVSLGREYLKDSPNAEIITMDVHNLIFEEKFDVVLCLQNGLSSMKITSQDLLEQILGMVESGGKVYFSTYSGKFWEYRLMWFREQAGKGLLGELDPDKTKDGVIICKDGFRALTHTPEALEAIGCLSGYEYRIHEVDESSVFLIIHKNRLKK